MAKMVGALAPAAAAPTAGGAAAAAAVATVGVGGQVRGNDTSINSVCKQRGQRLANLLYRHELLQLSLWCTVFQMQMAIRVGGSGDSSCSSSNGMLRRGWSCWQGTLWPSCWCCCESGLRRHGCWFAVKRDHCTALWAFWFAVETFWLPMELAPGWHQLYVSGRRPASVGPNLVRWLWVAVEYIQQVILD